MNVLFLTLAYPEGESNRNLYVDLMKEFYNQGNQVYVICQRERRQGENTELCNELGINVLRVKTGNVTKTGIIEKGISTLLLEYQFINAIKRYYSNIKFDLVLYSTPPITFGKIVKYVKKRDKSKTYLLLKDIFPQNAVDLGLMRKNGMLWRFFRNKERILYEYSDYIGCMSQANVEYVLTHNPELSISKLEICPNCISPSNLVMYDEQRKRKVRAQFNIPEHAVLLVYGGNLGKPQGVDFLIEILKCQAENQGVFFYIVGSGTEFAKIESYLRNSNQGNASLNNYFPKEKFDELLKISDVGLVFLDPRFTIPNFPSRMNSYMEHALPIIAATDVSTDIRDMFKKANCGLWCKNGDLDLFNRHLELLSDNKNLRIEMGMNGRGYLENNFTASKAYTIICSHLERRG